MSRLVVKVGGAMATGSAAHALLGDFVASSDEIAVVHGAGPQITAEMRRRRLPVEFVGGRRVTSLAALEVVRATLAAVNREVCAAVGPRAVGLMGDEIGLPARRIPELGLVGEPLPSRPATIESALASGLVPVVAPLAEGPLNVNADAMAAALAAGLGAERIVFVTDVPGLLRHGRVVEEIPADEAQDLLASGELEGGMQPKLTAAVTAARLGVRADIGETAVTA